jgi:beta-glucosidase
LPPFKAALDAGAATFMNSFNELNGIPATGNQYLQRNILKGKWNFTGFVVSDWGSIGEMVNHGFAKDKTEAAWLAIRAGSDMDMESQSYTANLTQLVQDKKVDESLVDDAARRVLTKKFELGLFDDPFRFCNETREVATIDNKEFHKAAREIAAKSIVLLKNKNHLLPLSRQTKKIAVIGPLAQSELDMKGAWAVKWEKDKMVSLFEGLQNKLSGTELLYAKGCDIKDTVRKDFSEAIAVAQKADVVIMAVGESFDMSGEAKSRTNIQLPGVQEELIKAIYATGKPMIVLIMTGRPLIFNWTADHIPAIACTWWLGSEAGNAIADVLLGDVNPSAKLTMSFPRAEGQIPIYYNYNNTGRPSVNERDITYRSAYIDMPNTPRFAFGYGLSYTSFKYDNLQLSTKKMKENDSIQVHFNVTNTGNVAGEEIVQLYLRDVVASVVRPVKELKGFNKIKLQPGETQTVSFILTKDLLSFYNASLEKVAEPGAFKLMIGAASDNILLEDTFELIQ